MSFWSHGYTAANPKPLTSRKMSSKSAFSKTATMTTTMMMMRMMKLMMMMMHGLGLPREAI